jgi:hypothetical protein
VCVAGSVLLHGYVLTSPQASDEFPELANYVGCWPVMDLVKMCLKYTLVRLRHFEEKKKAVGKIMQKRDVKGKE